MKNRDTILVVDDDQDHLALVERYVMAHGLPCVAVASGPDALECLEKEKISVVVTDMVMPVMDGMELLITINEKYPDISVVIMTGYSKQYSYIDVIKAGAADFIAKPFKKDEFGAKLKRILRENRLTQELRQAKEKAEEGSRAKTAFLSRMGHELRTPMNGVIGFSELLADSDLTPGEKGYAKIINESAHHLMQLIEEILDYAASDRGLKREKKEHFCLNNIFEVLGNKMIPKATEKGLALSFDLEETISNTLMLGDQFSLLKILGYILDNAIKFTDSGSIVVRVKKGAGFSKESMGLQFSVKDTGCGIDLQEQEEIFQPFTQVEDYMTREHDGVGLGLAACAKLVTMMNGQIWVKSAKGKGATFHFIVQMDYVKS